MKCSLIRVIRVTSVKTAKRRQSRATQSRWDKASQGGTSFLFFLRSLDFAKSNEEASLECPPLKSRMDANERE